MWSSFSTAPAVIPASALFYATPISGSPYNVSIVPGAAAYPYTEAFGEGVANASAGVPATFVIQAKVCPLLLEVREIWRPKPPWLENVALMDELNARCRGNTESISTDREQNRE